MYGEGRAATVSVQDNIPVKDFDNYVVTAAGTKSSGVTIPEMDGVLKLY